MKLLSRAIQPAIVFATTDENLNDTTIAARLSTFSKVDDVYSPAFDNILLLQSVGESPSQAPLSRINRNRRFNSVYTSVVQSQDEFLPSGPYFVVEDGIHQAWRLYPDTLGAFVTTVVPNTVQEPKRQALHGLSRNPLTWPNIVIRYSIFQAVAENGLYKVLLFQAGTVLLLLKKTHLPACGLI